jgi:hypothetical protein
MLAHHPTTGQPIKIIRSETQISSDNKTLVWVRAGFTPSARWNRWFPLCTEAAALDVLNGGLPCAIIVRDINDWTTTLRKLFPADHTNETLVLCNATTADKIHELEGVHCERVLLFEDLYDSYPYLGEPVHENDADEKCIISIAHVLRMNNIAWNENVDRAEMSVNVGVQYDAWSRTCDGRLVQIGTDDSCIPRTWLFQQYFKHPTRRRSREIQTCLEKNLASDFIDNVVLLNEESYTELPTNPKLQTQILGHRLTFADVLRTARTLVPAGDFVLFANSDIWFHDSLKQIWQVKMVERRLFLALLRWEDGDEPQLFGPRSDSQDSWICARDCLDFDVSMDEFGFAFGKPGCDNAITLLMLRKKFLVVNPAYSIKTMHVHASNVRNYDPKDVLYRPFYLYVDPSAIQPCAVVQNLLDIARPNKEIAAKWSEQSIQKSFVRQLHAVADDDVKIVCSMLRHYGGQYTYLPNEQNVWTPLANESPLYNFRGGVFVTADGLVSDFNKIYVGKHQEWIAGWQDSKQSSLTPCIHAPSLVVVPTTDAMCSSLSSWVLHYLPKALAIRGIVDDAPDFLVPSIPDVGSFLNDCVWKERNITVVPIMKDMNYYTENAWVVPPSNQSKVTQEDITRLRSLLPEQPAISDAEHPVAVFFVDDDADAVCTRGWAEETAEHIFPSGWTIRYISNNDLPAVRRRALCDASWVIGGGSALEWIWMAPAGATVMEFMNEVEPRGDIIHLAAACGQRHVIGLCKHREPVVNQRQNALMSVGRAIKKFGFKEIVQIKRKLGVEKPRIIIPCEQTGIWSHAGDTFREMAELWGKRGYVQIEHSPHTGHCWWGGIGEVLLYDRPTPRWLADEPTYQMALFGNPAPPGPTKQLMRQSVWGFWPRSPVSVEAMALCGHNLRGYAMRSIKSLFLGKVENGVQHAHRTGADWSSAVELFSMPIDSTGAAYPYNQTEYLEKLCNARFGLCLPGFGPKCNREIEYFACGTVPIVTKGVDMNNYLVPPRIGIHYFVAETPADVKRIVETTSPVKWALMSAAGREWWRTYASVEGFFRLTWSRIEQCRPYFDVGIPREYV